MRRSFQMGVVLIFALMFAANHARAEDAFYSLPIKDLKLIDGKIPQPKLEGQWYATGILVEPQVRPDGVNPREVEAYITYPNGSWSPQAWANGQTYEGTVVLRAPAGKDIAGQLLVPAEDWQSRVALRFTVPASAADPKGREAFLQGKLQHYESLLEKNLPGAAWFRHQSNESRRELGKTDKDDNRPPNRPSNTDLEDTYSLFSGGRAVSENLQLDRALLPRPGSNEATVTIETLAGITVKEMDWKPLIDGEHPVTDSLAAVIPIDQHAIFLPSFDATLSLMEEADRQGTPVLQLAESRGEDAGTKLRYQRQLCLPLSAIGRLLGPKLIAGVAITGSDPYLRIGADVAILFDPKDSPALYSLLSAQMGLASAGGSAEAVNGKVHDVSYIGFVSPDRRICAYLATVGKAVVVTNSLAQLQRLVDVQAGKSPALATAPEYTFFRVRYPHDEAGETGLIVLTDATIRRWCSPRWRIGDSRRTRAAAVMAEIQARHAVEIATGKVMEGPVHPDANLPETGDLRMTADGVVSSVYGSMEFMTPILELELSKVTQPEADTYTRWRDTYQQNWRNYFDPIAIRLGVTPAVLTADMTVMPLIANSDYAALIEISKGVRILPGSGDPHDALFHLALAINGKSERMRGFGSMAATFVPQMKVEPLSWIGPTAGFYVDNDPIWEEALKAREPEVFYRDHMDKLPIAIYIQSSNALILTAFLAGVHAFVDQSAPGMAVWEPQMYKDTPYVKITPTERAKRESREIANAAIYYSTVGGALLITPSEVLMKRAMDRQATPSTQPATQPAAAPTTRPWLGDQLCAQFDAKGLTKVVTSMMNSSIGPELRNKAWENLPILNEWKRLFPDKDPVQVHQRLWQMHLIDPAGGTYVWNEKLQTMESTEYGCPESPRLGPVVPPTIRQLGSANFGISFENQGLRAKAELYRDGSASPTPVNKSH